MNIIMHYPKSEQANEELKHRVAVVHAQTVQSYISGLSCPREQVLTLLKSVQDIGNAENT